MEVLIKYILLLSETMNFIQFQKSLYPLKILAFKIVLLFPKSYAGIVLLFFRETLFILVIDDCGFGFHSVTLLNVIFDTGMYIFYLNFLTVAFILWNSKKMPFDPVYYSYLDKEIFFRFDLPEDWFFLLKTCCFAK